MAWIELHQELRFHPKVIRLSVLAGCSRPEALGYVVGLWLYCAMYAKEGDLTKFSPEEIRLACDAPEGSNIVEGLEKAGFLDKTDEGVFVHDWSEHGLKLLNSQKERKERYLAKQGTGKERSENIQVTSTLPNRTIPNQPTEPTVPRVGNPMPSDLENRKIDLEAYLLVWWGKQGRISSAMMQEFLKLKNQYGYTALGEAIIKSAKANATTFRYVEGILRPRHDEKPIDRTARSRTIQSVSDLVQSCELHTDTNLVDGLCPKCYPTCNQCKQRHAVNEKCEDAAKRLAEVKRMFSNA